MGMFSKSIAILIASALAIPAIADVSLVGTIPSREVPHLQENLNRIWEHESATYSKTATALPAPEIGFFAFQGAQENPGWQAWQKQFDGHLDSILPFPSEFLAFHYDHTNRIQISPRITFLRYYLSDAYGIMHETVGYGFYVAAHEMLHYVLENNGVPSRLHHCLFVTEKNAHSLMSDMADYLVAQNISAPIIRKLGYDYEKGMGPCTELSDTERAQIQQILDGYE
jgi:hypothetical protein